MNKRSTILATLIGLVASTAQAYRYQPTPVPEAVNRANAWINDHPDRAEGYFFLGGVQGSAWAKGTSGKGTEIDVATFGDAVSPPRIVPWESVLFGRDTKREVAPDGFKSLGASIAAYRKAVELSPDKPLYHLALAWSLEEIGEAKLHAVDVPGEAPAALTDDEKQRCQAALKLLRNTETASQGSRELAELMPRNAKLLMWASEIENNSDVGARIDAIRQEYWTTQAIEQYRKAYQQSVEKDLAAANYDSEADNTVSVKAGERLLLLLPKQPDSSADEFKKIDESVRAIKAKKTVGHAY